MHSKRQTVNTRNRNWPFLQSKYTPYFFKCLYNKSLSYSFPAFQVIHTYIHIHANHRTPIKLRVLKFSTVPLTSWVSPVLEGSSQEVQHLLQLALKPKAPSTFRCRCLGGGGEAERPLLNPQVCTKRIVGHGQKAALLQILLTACGSTQPFF